jgi:hypothetical protein
MGRRLAEATKACRTRRTRGETALCFFLLVAAVDFFFWEVFRAGVFLAVLFFSAAVLSDEGDD